MDFGLSEEHKRLQQMARDFANDKLAPIADELDRKQEFAWDNFKGMAELGLYGLTIPEEYGGCGGDELSIPIVAEEIAGDRVAGHDVVDQFGDRVAVVHRVGAVVHTVDLYTDRSRVAAALAVTNLISEGRLTVKVGIRRVGNGVVAINRHRAVGVGPRRDPRHSQPIAVDIDLICLKELLVTSGFASTPRSWHRVEKLIESGAVVLDPLVTDVSPLSEWEISFARARKADGLKLMLDPRMDD